MTDTTKTVQRRSVLPHPKHGRQVVVKIGEGDVVCVRLEREQRERCIPLSHLYDYIELRSAASANNFNTSPCSNPRKSLLSQ